jgi:hypothetical protein
MAAVLGRETGRATTSGNVILFSSWLFIQLLRLSPQIRLCLRPRRGRRGRWVLVRALVGLRA